MLPFFRRDDKKSEKAVLQPAPAQAEDVKTSEKTPEQSKAEFVQFHENVIETKMAVIAAIEKMDKHDAIENLIRLSNLSAKAIYNKNLRGIVVVDDAILDIKRDIDQKLDSIRTQGGEGKDEEAEYYMLLRLSLIPVCSMLSVINQHTTTAIEEANDEIDHRIQELQRFLVDYETHITQNIS